MVKVPMGSTTMDLLPLLCLCVLTRFGSTLADGPGHRTVPVVVPEKSDAILPCSISTKENIEKKGFDWKKDDKKEVFLYDAGLRYIRGRTGQDEQFKDRVSYFKDELKNGNASIKIINTKMADNGNYTCTFPNQQTSQITLIVGAVSRPLFKTLGVTQDGVFLQCEVFSTSSGFKLNISWWDSSEITLTYKEINVTERGVSYILNTTVTKSGKYRCVATQLQIYHQVFTENYVPVPAAGLSDRTDGDQRGETSTGSSSGMVILIIVVVVLCLLLAVVLAVVLTVICCKKSKPKKDENHTSAQSNVAAENGIF